MLALPHRRFGVERIVSQFLKDEPYELVLRHASLLLQPFDGAEAGPIGAFEFRHSCASLWLDESALEL